MKPDVTIFADASMLDKLGVAGWGMWAKGDNRNTITRGGRY